ncbi:MAG: hypothetical protein ACYC3F_05310 [Gemmatimonadaceae bacterium]
MSFEYYYFTKPSFLRGVGRAIDISGVISREAVILSPTTHEADRRAVESDWRVVGEDIRKAAGALEENGATR